MGSLFSAPMLEEISPLPAIHPITFSDRERHPVKPT